MGYLVSQPQSHTTGLNMCLSFCCRLNSCGEIPVSLQLSVIYMEKCLLQSFKEIKRSDHLAVSKTRNAGDRSRGGKKVWKGEILIEKSSRRWQLCLFLLMFPHQLSFASGEFEYVKKEKRDWSFFVFFFFFFFSRIFLTFRQNEQQWLCRFILNPICTFYGLCAFCIVGSSPVYSPETTALFITSKFSFTFSSVQSWNEFLISQL